MPEHFVIAGAQRCGTTFLAAFLGAHPEIEMASPARPEPRFFLRDDLGADAADEYARRYFGHKAGAHLRGEKSTSYLEYEEAASRLERHLPGVRVVVVVRDPVERAISHVRFSRENGLEPRSVDEALCPDGPPAPPWDPATVSVNPFAYRERGRYVDYLRPFSRHINRSRLLVVVFEEMLASREPLLGVLTFLGVEPGLAPSKPEPDNEADAERSALAPHCRRALVDYFHRPNLELEAFLGRPLNGWARPDAS